jgi:hypothetical protein
MRQGAGKIKHLSGKILWIQQWVMEGKIVLVQVPTLWNLSDIGTKLLSGQRMKLLMHELTMAHGDCSGLVGLLDKLNLKSSASDMATESKLQDWPKLWLE